MSTYYPPAGTVVYSGTSPYDIAGITADINRAVASLKPEERGAVTVRVDQGGAGGGLVLRGPSLGRITSAVLATVTKPVASRYGWSISGRVSFLAGGQTPEAPARLLPKLRGAYALLRALGHSVPAALLKACAILRGREVPLLPEGARGR